MIQIIWEFRVKPGQELQFERHYSASGTWAGLFRKSAAYRGTTLLRDRDNEHRYLTIDRWDDEDSFLRFKNEFANDYEALDKQCEALTEAENRLGVFAAAGR